MNILDHVGLSVSDYGSMLRFYEQALAPLGIGIVMRMTKEESSGYEGAGLGRDGKPSLWIQAGGRTSPHVHVALVAESRAAVDAFHAAAIEAGGSDNGSPGIRAHYHPSYYAAFVLDPDGHNIEAVCHRSE